MAEILVKFDEPITARNGDLYFAQAVGTEVQGGLWNGWLEFQPVNDGLDALVSGRETTQPNRTNLEYWAQGLTKVYLEGALDRAILLAGPPREKPPETEESPLFDSPRSREGAVPPGSQSSRPRAILDPFQVYGQGERILRSELNALSVDHLAAIAAANRIRTLGLSGIESSAKPNLIEAIVAGVRDRLGDRYHEGDTEQPAESSNR